MEVHDFGPLPTRDLVAAAIDRVPPRGQVNEQAAADEERMISIMQGHAPACPKLLRITSISFETLVSLGNYENAKFGAVCHVADGDDPVEAMGELSDWVNRQAGKPTRAEKAACKRLDELELLYLTLSNHISQAHYNHGECQRISRELLEIKADPAASLQLQPRIGSLESGLQLVKANLENAKVAIDLKTKEIQAAEQRPEILAARSLLKKPAPALPTIADDDIPY